VVPLARTAVEGAFGKSKLGRDAHFRRGSGITPTGTFEASLSLIGRHTHQKTAAVQRVIKIRILQKLPASGVWSVSGSVFLHFRASQRSCAGCETPREARSIQLMLYGMASR
jgi:hypothetical protein